MDALSTLVVYILNIHGFEYNSDKFKKNVLQYIELRVSLAHPPWLKVRPKPQ